MRSYLVLICLAIILSSISCKKKEIPVVFTGKIVHLKDSSVFANSMFVIYARQESSKGVVDATQKFSTNADGYFKVEFIPKARIVSICYPDFVTQVPEGEVGRAKEFGKAYDFGTLYANR